MLWLGSDVQGSVTSVADAAGGVLGGVTYDLFGQVRASSLTDAVRRGVGVGFTGYQLNTDASLNARARQYVPSAGRFTGVDQVAWGPGSNPYSYVGNAPTWLVDPTGMFGWSDAWEFGSGAVSSAWSIGAASLYPVLNPAAAGTDMWNGLGVSLDSESGVGVGGTVWGLVAAPFLSGKHAWDDFWAADCWSAKGDAFSRGVESLANIATMFAGASKAAGAAKGAAGLAGKGVDKAGVAGTIGSGSAKAAAKTGVKTPSNLLLPGGLKLPGVPQGVAGVPTRTGKGLEYSIPKGTPELSPRVSSVRIMDPVTSGKYQYPNGYATYMNERGQTVNPLTGQTITKSDPFWHIELTQ